jgi:D-alanine-D-alanine ligase
MSARSVLSVLSSDRYEITQIGITHDGCWLSGQDVLERFTRGNTTGLLPVVIKPEPGPCTIFVEENTPNGLALHPLTEVDVIFPVLHGTYGEDGTLQGLLEMADVAYVGAGVLGSSVGMDKALFKDVMRANQVPVLESIMVTRTEIEKQLEAVLARCETVARYPLFVKPANLGSSVGVTKCKSRSDLLEGLMEAARFDRRILVERGVNGREIEVSVLGNEHPQASVPGEIRPADEFYTYEAKYINERSELIIPANIPAETAQQVRELAVKAYIACDCAGMARADFLLDKETGDIYLNEINTIPGFTKISMYPKLWEASGLPYPELVQKLIELATERKNERDRSEHRYRRGA